MVDHLPLLDDIDTFTSSTLLIRCFQILKKSAAKKDVESAMLGHILGECELVGTYQKKR